MIRIVLADDHPIVLQGLQHLFARHAEFEVVACCADAAAALDAVRLHHPHVALIDLRMPGKGTHEDGGLNLLSALAAESTDCRRIVLTAAVAPDKVVEILRLGASGLILKDASPERLLECVRQVYAGEQWLDPDMASRAPQDVMDRDPLRGEVPHALTVREVEIVRMAAQGLRNRAIGEQLGISESTVKVHLYNIFQKLDVEGRVELLLWAQQRGLV
jgi:DNA-binding NarL/FixJ family response regulator